jgi:GDP-L-fucose synthase
MSLNKDETIFVAGHRGMAGGAIHRRLTGAGFTRVMGKSRAELDLLDRGAVRAFFAAERPAVVVVAAAKVGGILANWEQPVAFLLQNLTIQNNLIEAAADHGARKLLFLGSSCIYPKLAPQPISEDALLTGPLEATNDAYAIAKIAGIKLCQAYAREFGRTFISAMPTNLYGPGDNYDLRNSHVLPALIRKVHEAKIAGERSITVWGSGNPRREFLHTSDLADACVFLLEKYDAPDAVNIGCGEDVTIRELAETICDVLGFDGSLEFDTSKPDGTPRKLLDISKIRSIGWSPKIPLREGIADAYRWFCEHQSEARL